MKNLPAGTRARAFPSLRRPSAGRHAIFVLSLLLAPLQATAVGAEDTRYFGRNQAGGLVQLGFLTDPESWAGEVSAYGSRSLAALAFCSFVLRPDVADELHCALARGQPATVVYRALAAGDDAPAFNARTPEGARYRSIAREAKLGNGDRRGDGTLVRILACTQGCTPAVPGQLFEVALYD